MGATRILVELGSTDDSVWTYFDSQHKYIMNQMSQSYKTALATIRSTHPPVSIFLVQSSTVYSWSSGAKESHSVGSSTSDDIGGLLAQQLQTCFVALEAKQSDTVIGMNTLDSCTVYA